MQITILLAIAFAAFCSGQATEFANLPSCAKSCAVGSLPKDCNLDVKCICSKQSFIHDIACCVSKSCPASDIQKSLQVAQQLCSTVSITVPSEIPRDCAGGSSSAAPSSSGVTSLPASSGTSSGATSAAASATSAAASAASAATSAAPSNAASCNYLGNNIGALGAGIIAAVFL